MARRHPSNTTSSVGTCSYDPSPGWRLCVVGGDEVPSCHLQFAACLPILPERNIGAGVKWLQCAYQLQSRSWNPRLIYLQRSQLTQLSRHTAAAYVQFCQASDGRVQKPWSSTVQLPGELVTPQWPTRASSSHAFTSHEVAETIIHPRPRLSSVRVSEESYRYSRGY